VIQKELMDSIAKKLLAGDIADSSVIEVKADDHGLEIGKAVVN
jgi:ATP-dependent Clp protease ATP-binding subunit ClpB